MHYRISRVITTMKWRLMLFSQHYNDAIMSAMVSQITGVSIVFSTVCWGSCQRKHQSFASLATFVSGIHWWPVGSPHKGPEALKMFLFDGVIMVMVSTKSYTSKWEAIRQHLCKHHDMQTCWPTLSHWNKWNYIMLLQRDCNVIILL